MNKVIFLFLSIILISSCSKKDTPIGLWDDNIKLSTKNVEFGVNADSVVITTEGDWWWVAEITLNDSSYSYYNNENINLESDSYTIIEDHFVVERRDKNTLFIKLDENMTGEERVMIITLEAGDYFDHVKINQLAN
ncbi:MAG: hypothetical protein C0591_11220 [Marinilabiliales bacterium]|nr:MAG: hypothetical protein C0591_11220 [Marinilabiliales bacterium]